ncbi:hypothetical protein ElyMa_003377200 [Elysia marginata]|uniref:Uncharacterized protein n=1 Tax=Elysia marginata TaxID=1093978 RepID=A0AAV4JLG8_9GAST|nr:hypothetical protein ElyMa_003377200 [Elysia marginata]
MHTSVFLSELLQACKYHYYSVNTRKAKARLAKVKDGGLTDLWEILREIIRKRRPLSNQKVTWYTLVQESETVSPQSRTTDTTTDHYI